MAFLADKSDQLAGSQPWGTNLNSWGNAYDPGGIYPGVPTSPAVPNYGTVTQTQSGAISNYNAMNFTLREQIGSQLILHFNYTYGHNLDETSNGGINAYSFTGDGSILDQINPHSLRANNYGNSEYDIRHNISADYVYTPTFKFGNKFAQAFLGGWQWSGKLYWRTALPFTVIDGNLGGEIVNYAATSNGNPLEIAQPIGAGQQGSCGVSSNYTNGAAVFGELHWILNLPNANP